MTSNTLRTIVISLAVAVAVAIASYVAFGGEGTPVATATTTTAQTAPTPEPEPAPLTDNPALYDNEAEFILAIEDYDGVDYSASDEVDIVAGGYVICSDLAAGYDPVDEALYLADEFGLSAYEGGLMVSLTVDHLCPEYSDAVDAAIDA